jgi:hypothetical protein
MLPPISTPTLAGAQPIRKTQRYMVNFWLRWFLARADGKHIHRDNDDPKFPNSSCRFLAWPGYRKRIAVRRRWMRSGRSGFTKTAGTGHGEWRFEDRPDARCRQLPGRVGDDFNLKENVF